MSEMFDWVMPAPMWPNGTPRKGDEFFRPALLEFKTDDFMNEYFRLVQQRLADRWLEHRPAKIEGRPLKLYQPFHQRFYLVCASLCCRMPGFPDHEVARANGERVFFVLRRFDGRREQAWIADGPTKGWNTVAAPARTIPEGEEQHAMFVTAAASGRTLAGGYVRVGSRETYRAAPEESIADTTIDVRVSGIASRLEGGIDVLDRGRLDDDYRFFNNDAAQSVRVSVYLLLDLWEFLLEHAPRVALALRDGAAVTTDAERSLLEWLGRQRLGRYPFWTYLMLDKALGTVARQRDALVELHEAPLPSAFTPEFSLRDRNIDIPTLRARLHAVMPPATLQDSHLSEVPRAEMASSDFYIVRCVYERPMCERRFWIGQRSEPFLLAPLFDVEAPARPIRIPMPADLSLSELRKSARGAGVVLSPTLRSQIEQVLKVVPFGFQPPTPNLPGTMCSLSIPIVTICAFILLTIIVRILNVVFRWLPYFEECVPLRNLPSRPAAPPVT
jgi:hypothetical protein